MFEHISPERKTGHHSETTGINLLGLETIYIVQVMIKNSGNLHMVPTASRMNLLAPPKIGKIDQCSFHIVCMLEYQTTFEEYAICYLLYAVLFLFVCLCFFAKPFLLCFSLCSSIIFLFNPYFSVFHVFSLSELSYISNIYIICLETNSKTSRFIQALGISFINTYFLSS